MSKILCFVFAVAIFGSVAKAEFVPYTLGSPVTPIIGGSKGISKAPSHSKQVIAKLGNEIVNPYEKFVSKLAKQVGGLTSAQSDAALAITVELNNHLIAQNLPTNDNLAAYLLATAYVDSSLVPTEEKLRTDDKAKIQATYFKHGHQGRGYVPFTGAFNYNRFARDINVNIDTNPALLLDKNIAAKVLIFGALNGRFTGTKIGKFIPASGNVDFVGARRAINGDVNAVSVAKLASDIAK